jgi:hypothetical protein
MKALTANRLVDGEVVFWADGAWVEQFAKAELFYDSDAGEAALAVAKAQMTTVVDVYLFDVTEFEGLPVPVSYRERLRALGPTNEPNHGKQAAGGPEIAALTKATAGGHTTGRIDLLRKS